MTVTYHSGRRIQGTNITTSIQGNNGGSGQHSSGAWAGSGGGGGSSSVGANSSTSAGGNGGNGTANTISGSSITYATGGSGAGNVSDGTGGSSNANNNNVGQSATANRGSGGGGAKNGTQGGAGSSGIVVIRFTTSGNTYSQAGGTVTTSGSDTIISYTTTSGTKSFTPSSSFNVQYLVVGGGGSAGAGNEPTGAGGAGGYLEGTGYGVTAQSYSITVGAGGAQPSTTAGDLGNDGSNSRFDDFIAIGGGAGGGRSNTESIRKGRDGASGGGSGTDVAGSSGATTGGSATTQTIDEKPTNVQLGSRYEETDTRKMYNFRAGSTPTVSDDFSSDNWTDVGGLFGVSGGDFAFTINTNARDDHASLDTGSLLSASTTWTLRFNKINFSTITNNDPNLIIGLSDTTVGGKQNQKFIGARILPQGGSASGLFRPYSVNGTPPRSGQDASHTLQYSADTDYFVEIKKTSASTYRARLSTTSAHSGDLIDDSQGGINSSITGRYIKVMNGEDEIGGTLIGTIDSIEFWTPAPDEPINTSNHFEEIGV